jgi:hypothetical protein
MPFGTRVRTEAEVNMLGFSFVDFSYPESSGFASDSGSRQAAKK